MRPLYRFLVLLILVIGQKALSQKLPSSSELYKYYKQESELLLVNEGDTLVDIGAATGEINAMYAVMINNLHQVLVDIDKKQLNARIVKSNFKRWIKRFKSKNSFSYTIHNNTERTVNLSDTSCSTILCRRSFHEFSLPKPMLKELYRILRDTGCVIVMEPDFGSTRKMDPGCNRPYLPKEAVISQFQENGFLLIRQSSIRMPFDHNNEFYVLYFQKD